MTLEKVAVIGAGTMGSGIAQVFAHYGMTVSLIDLQPSLLDRALLTIGKSLDRMVKKGTVTASHREQTLSRISMAQR